MNINLIIFNIAYYFITFLLYYQTQQDPSSSLGIGLISLLFWAIAALLLIIFIKKKIIKIKSLADKIGIFTATPVLTFCVINIFLSINGDGGGSEWYFDKNNHRYKVITKLHRGSSHTKSIEYYKSERFVDSGAPFENIDKWVKDSVWLYFKANGDTSKKVKYRNNIKID